MGSGAGVPGQYRRNMEAVGEFEQVWGGAGGGREDDSVPLTKELSAEFNRDDIQCCCETPVNNMISIKCPSTRKVSPA